MNADLRRIVVGGVVGEHGTGVTGGAHGGMTPAGRASDGPSAIDAPGRALSGSARARPWRTAIGRAIGGWPIWLHRVGLGRLAGRRFVVITSVGRRTGRLRRVAAMVLREDRETGELLVVAATRETNWYRNVSAQPAVEVWVGARRFRPRQRLLSPEEIVELLTSIRRDRPLEARVQAAFFGWPWPASAEQISILAAWLGGVGFRPDAGGSR